jgi:hypothetical protein
MKHLVLTLVLLSAAGVAQAAVPVFSAQCPTDIRVATDAQGKARINGKAATVKKLNDKFYSLQGSGVTVDVALDPLTVSYTGKHRAHGICQVTAEGAAAAPGPAAAPVPTAGLGMARDLPGTVDRASQGRFNATGQILCAQAAGQPMTQCNFGVARAAGGTATVVITKPDGRKRTIFFEKGQAVSADLSQADGDMNFRASKRADLFVIEAGKERYEMPEAVIFGG